MILKTNEGKLCLNSIGKFTLTPKSCFRFSEDKFEIDTTEKSLKKLVFKPTHLKVEGIVKLKD